MTTQIDLVTEETDPPKLNSTLNVLTILTIIGCSLGALVTIATPWLTGFMKKAMDKAAEGELTPDKMEQLRKGREALEITENNMVALLAVSFIGLILCFVGALMMRKLKKDGYWLYVAGQIIPIVGGVIIAGTSQYQSGGAFFMPAVAIVFIILYTIQKKTLVY
ncbi:DUF4064 domain-containing protein [Ferruginibacter sp. HRS2-29]|uniref:DUF4064 domain-containing protein n=1 Tax=Ferruginibacter sp. HRS2-29 TaxID=2487334 RepID=UPI0020CC043A|nr:DUF4064 domain-containing protein [Ferruginibacter sp. HRS2-29]MCP9749433.1 hypothetical protein [Ferruginibacter sp. HRS2-29]